jgi:hypothetical protein
VFRRFEPSVTLFIGTVVALQAPLFLWLGSAFSANLWQAILTADASFLGALTVSIALYRLFFHPLRKYPGPFLARLSKLWLASVCRDGETLRVVRELHKKYGDIVRIGPNELSFANADAIPIIYSPRPHLVKGTWYTANGP